MEREELKDRVVYGLMLPAVRLATTFNVPLTQMKRWVETAYYQETKRRGMEMKEARQVMSVSLSKVALLSRQLKENFMREEDEYELPRRIEYMLWAEPLTLARLNQVLPEMQEGQVAAAVELLLEEERIRPVDRATDPAYELNVTEARRVWDTWLARLDGLSNSLGSVADAVYARFFEEEEGAFARTLTFHVRDEDVDKLKEFYEEQLFPFVAGLNAEAESEADAPVVSLSIFWAEKDYAVDDADDAEDAE
jgi:hypothetical protein